MAKKKDEKTKGKDKPKKKEDTAMTVSEQGGMLSRRVYTREQIELIKRICCKGATDDEMDMFLHYCKQAEVDPLRKQAHFIKYKKDDTPIMMIGIDGFQARATSDGRYIGIVSQAVRENDEFELNPVTGAVEHTIKATDRGKVVGAYAILKRERLDPATIWVDFKEYDTGRSVWRDKPEVMITKVARATLLRREYPDSFSGVYAPEEFGSEITEKGDFIEHKKPEVKPFPNGQPMREAGFTDESEEESEEPEPEDDGDDEARTIPDDLVDDDMKPREALDAIMKYAVDNSQGAFIRPVIIEHYPKYTDGSRYPYHIPETKVIKIVEELTGIKLKKAEKVKKCIQKECGAKVTEPEAEEQQDDDGKPLCLKCWQKEND